MATVAAGSAYGELAAAFTRAESRARTRRPPALWTCLPCVGFCGPRRSAGSTDRRRCSGTAGLLHSLWPSCGAPRRGVLRACVVRASTRRVRARYEALSRCSSSTWPSSRHVTVSTVRRCGGFVPWWIAGPRPTSTRLAGRLQARTALECSGLATRCCPRHQRVRSPQSVAPETGAMPWRSRTQCIRPRLARGRRHRERCRSAERGRGRGTGGGERCGRGFCSSRCSIRPESVG